MIAPLLWLLLVATSLAQPGVAPWDGKAPVVVTRPVNPKAGTTLLVGVAELPPRARNVRVSTGDQTVPAERVTAAVRRARIFLAQAGPLTITVQFTVGGTPYEAPGGVVLVAPRSSSP